MTLRLRRPRSTTQIARPTYDCPLEHLATFISTSDVADTTSSNALVRRVAVSSGPETGRYGAVFSDIDQVKDKEIYEKREETFQELILWNTT